MSTPADTAARVLRSGGVIVYPTEGVFGIGCLPDDADAVSRVLQIKRRSPSKGLILIASGASQLEPWIELPNTSALPESDDPVTWIVPASKQVSRGVRGDNDGIAVRITMHPVARAICEAVASPIVSTSANLSGQPVAMDQADLHQQFTGLVDYIVPGDCGPSSGPSEIRILATGEVLRPR